jgi:hypothetical protein
MSAHPSAGAQHPPAAHDALWVVVVGGGIAAAEALLALRDLAGEQVSLTLVCPNDQLATNAPATAARGRSGDLPTRSTGNTSRPTCTPPTPTLTADLPAPGVEVNETLPGPELPCKRTREL